MLTNHDELCEKVLPYKSGFENHYSENQNKIDRQNLVKALTSGLLCDGKELEEAKKVMDIRLRKEAEDLEAINSLKLKLEDAEKDKEALLDDVKRLSQEKHNLNVWFKAVQGELSESKLSGSCEGMTVEAIEKILKENVGACCNDSKDPNYPCEAWATNLDGTAKAIHAQMTGGKK